MPAKSVNISHSFHVAAEAGVLGTQVVLLQVPQRGRLSAEEEIVMLVYKCSSRPPPGTRPPTQPAHMATLLQFRVHQRDRFHRKLARKANASARPACLLEASRPSTSRSFPFGPPLRPCPRGNPSSAAPLIANCAFRRGNGNARSGAEGAVIGSAPISHRPPANYVFFLSAAGE